jgi:hypothetical protein
MRNTARQTRENRTITVNVAWKSKAVGYPQQIGSSMSKS